MVSWIGHVGDDLVDERPETFRGLQLWRVRGEEDQVNPVGDLEVRRLVPARAIEADDDPAALATVWAAFSGELQWRHGEALRRHAAKGVRLPEALWRAVLTQTPTDPDLLARAPWDVAIDHAEAGHGWHGALACLWRRDTAASLDRVSELLGAELGALVRAWLHAAPDEAIPLLIDRIAATNAGAVMTVTEVRFWLEQVISMRAPGWETAWGVWRGVRE